MALPQDLQQSLDRLRVNAAVDELRLMAEQLVRLGKYDAAKVVSERADTLSARIRKQSRINANQERHHA